MKDMKASELRAKSVEELRAEIKEVLKAQFGLRMQMATQQTTKTDQLKKLGRDVARMRTIICEKARKA